MKKKNSLFTVISLCLMAASSIGLFINSLGVFFTPIAESLNEKRGSVAIFYTIIVFTNAIGSILILRLATNRNYRRIYLCGIIGTVAGLVIMANARSLALLYGGSLLVGISICTYFMVIITTIINCSFRENIGSITGIVLSFSGIAGAVFSPLLAAIISAYGWGAGFYAMALLAAVLCLPGLFADFRVEGEASQSRDRESAGSSYLTAAFIFAVAMSFFFMFITAVPQHFTGIASSKGMSVGPLLVSASMIGNIVFKLVSGALADRIGGLRTMLVIAALNIAGAILILTSGNTVICLAGAFLFGAIYSNTSVILSYFCRELFGADGYRKAYPVVVFAGNISNALAITAIGYIFDFTGSYNPALIAVVFLALAGFLMAVIGWRSRQHTN